MSFKEMMFKIKEHNQGEVILMRNGAFYIAIDNDAVYLHHMLKLKCTCFSKGICKVGIPTNYIDKYKERLDNLESDYSVYDFDGDKISLKYQKIKNQKISEIQHNIECYKCSKYKKMLYEDKYDKAVSMYFDKSRDCTE